VEELGFLAFFAANLGSLGIEQLEPTPRFFKSLSYVVPALKLRTFSIMTSLPDQTSTERVAEAITDNTAIQILRVSIDHSSAENVIYLLEQLKRMPNLKSLEFQFFEAK
jgi:hypothetical protein